MWIEETSKSVDLPKTNWPTASDIMIRWRNFEKSLQFPLGKDYGPQILAARSITLIKRDNFFSVKFAATLFG